MIIMFILLLFLVAMLGFLIDEVAIMEGTQTIVQVPVGVTVGFLGVVVEATVTAIPGTAEGTVQFNKFTLVQGGGTKFKLEGRKLWWANFFPYK